MANSEPSEAKAPKTAKAEAKPEQPASRKPGRPRVEEKHLTLAATKPWEKLGMSRRTWERRQKEKRDG